MLHIIVFVGRPWHKLHVNLQLKSRATAWLKTSPFTSLLSHLLRLLFLIPILTILGSTSLWISLAVYTQHTTCNCHWKVCSQRICWIHIIISSIMLDLFEFLEIFTHLDCFCFSSFIVTDLLSLFTLSRKFHFRLLLMIKFAANFVFTTGDLLASVVTLFMK